MTTLRFVYSWYACLLFCLIFFHSIFAWKFPILSLNLEGMTVIFYSGSCCLVMREPFRHKSVWFSPRYWLTLLLLFDIWNSLYYYYDINGYILYGLYRVVKWIIFSGIILLFFVSAGSSSGCVMDVKSDNFRL